MADIAVVEIVDLPLADSEGAIEKQLKSDNGKINSSSSFSLSSVHHFVNIFFTQHFLEYFTSSRCSMSFIDEKAVDCKFMHIVVAVVVVVTCVFFFVYFVSFSLAV